MSTKIVVNADDFGISEPVSREIVTCMAAGRVSSATVLANGDWFEGACTLARSEGIHNRLGVHINLTFGRPCSAAMVPFCDQFGHLQMGERLAIADSALRQAIAEEVRSQIRAVLAQGIQPTHVDSHEHIHYWPTYLLIILSVIPEFGIRRVRALRNLYISSSVHRRLMKGLFNRFLDHRGVLATDWFTDYKPYLEGFARNRWQPPGTVELMCHPGAMFARRNGETISETAQLLGPEFGQLIRSVGGLCSHADLARP